MGEWVQRRAQVDALDGYATLAFGRNLNKLPNSISGCRRIAGTPPPFAYSVMIRRTVYFFCATLPFGLMENIGSFTPMFAVLVAYTFTTHKTITSQLEDPFGTGDNDLTLNALSNTIGGVVLDILGEPSPLPCAGVRRGVTSD